MQMLWFKKLKSIFFRYQPLANNLLNKQSEKGKVYPLSLLSKDCFNCQLSVAVNSEEMFSNYLYQSPTTKTFREHFEKAAEKYVQDFNLDKDSI